MTDDATARRLRDGARALDIPLSDQNVADLLRLSDLLFHWNRSINLVARGTDAARLVDRHLLDSLALTRLVPERGHVVDIGSGAGFPAMPLHIVGGARSTFVEPSGRRCSFLRAVARELGLEGVDVRTEREEALRPGEDVDAAEIVMSRATFAPAEWLVIGARWVPAGGRLVVMTSQQDGDALVEAAEGLGLALEARDVFTLPDSDARRENLLFGRL